MPLSSRTTAFYSTNASALCEAYEQFDPDHQHKPWKHLVPTQPTAVLDVGCGSGRDAAWFAGLGHEVVAVDPAEGMLAQARQRHADAGVHWLHDGLPALDKVYALDLKFGFIQLSAVWMHIPPKQRKRAFRKLANLLRPGGILLISLRHGPFHDGRVGYPVSVDELKGFAANHALEPVLVQKGNDGFDRKDVTWELVGLRLPDDGTGALPLLRHVVVNDAKSATYKLALLRVLVRIADGTRGAVTKRSKGFVHIPFGLVSLYWIRMYRPLVLGRDMLQRPKENKLGFLRQPFRELKDIPPQDLTVGRTFDDTSSVWLTKALNDVSRHIEKMPAHYITLPGTDDPVFPVQRSNVPYRTSYRLSIEYLSEFGTLAVPEVLWNSLSQYAAWIEPAIVYEWAELMKGYDRGMGRNRPTDSYLKALTWLDPERNTNEVRKVIDQMLSVGRPVHCAWTGSRLRSRYEVDHCFPFAFWPNNDLWNLLPCSVGANGRKSDRLPSAHMLAGAADRMQNWWHSAHLLTERSDRFLTEAHASLPSFRSQDPSDLFSSVQEQRMRLKVDQQIGEWEG